MLANDIKLKRQPMEKDQALALMRVLANMKMYNEDIIQRIMTEFELHFKDKHFSLTDVHSLVKSLYQMELIDTDTMNHLISYIVDCGYDGEDF